MRRLTLALLAIGAAGCAREAPAPDPSLGTFDRLLAEAYETRRAAEFEERDFRDARIFRRQRDAALMGQRPAPDDLSMRELPEALRAELAEARAALVTVLDSPAVLSAPEATASAQGAFDCWVQEAEEGTQPDDIGACRTEFETALAIAADAADDPIVVLLPELKEGGGGGDGAIVVSGTAGDVVIDTPFAGVAGAAAGADAAVAFEAAEVERTLAGTLDAEPLPQRSYFVYFETGSSDITPASQEAFDAAVADAQARPVARVTVYGHTDRVGSASVNVRLARARAEQVVALLIAAGLPEEILLADSFGESFPLVPTPDGVAEAENRRVEIAVR